MSEYVRGPSYARSLHATIRTKPTPVTSEHRDSDGNLSARVDTGGGYERIRSTEYRNHTSRDGSEDVYAYVHRLCAVAWCYPDDMSTAEVLQHLEGRDVHHRHEVEWLNIGESPNFGKDGLGVRGHGEHSRITQAQMRAWAADAKRTAAADGSGRTASRDACVGCGADEGALATTDTLDGKYCLECVVDCAPDGDAIRVL